MKVGASVKNPFVGFLAMEHRNGNTPRDLAGNVPIFKAFKVVDKDILFVFRIEFDFVIFKVGNGGFC